MAAAHTLNINQAAVSLLSQALVQGGWYGEKDQTALVYRAGQILDLPEMEPPKRPGEKATDDELKAWAEVPVAVPLTEKQRDAAKACLEFHLKRASLGACKPLNVLMRALGIAPEE